MKEITYREAIRDAMSEEMRADARVFLIGEEVALFQGAYKASQGMLEEFGSKRVIDTPITEHGFAGIGVGAAMAGLRPIVEFMTFNFAVQAMDHIINSAAKTKYMSGGLMSCPIVFRGPNGPGTRVGAQHSHCYASWFANVPGLKVIAPFFASDAKLLLKEAIRHDGPVVFLENELLYGYKFPHEELVSQGSNEIGKAKVIVPGDDVTIVSFSLQMDNASKATVELKKIGINAELIDLRTVRPIDFETIIASVKKTNRLVTVESGWKFASIGASIAAVVSQEAFDYLDAPVLNVNGTEVPMPYALNLEKLSLPQVKDIIDACRQVCYTK
jgi:pyruvate dehydrogenase E1 component beta subunit